VKVKTKAELLREQLAQAEAEEKAQAMMAPKPEDPEVGPAPSNFDELLDGLLPN